MFDFVRRVYAMLRLRERAAFLLMTQPYIDDLKARYSGDKRARTIWIQGLLSRR